MATSALAGLPMTLGTSPTSGASASALFKAPPAIPKKTVMGGSTQNPTTPSQPSASGSPNPSNPQPDYYAQALGLLTPSMTAAIQPYSAMLKNLPNLYSTEATGLAGEASAIQGVGQAETQQVEQQAQAGQQAIRQGGISQLGQQRANNAGQGFASSSGTEQSQEGNINNQIAMQMYNLDANANSQLTSIASMTQEQIAPILNQIAMLPQQEAQQALQIGAQIASINQEGSGAALTYAGQMAGYTLQAEQLGISKTDAMVSIINALANLTQKTNPKPESTTTTKPLFGIPGLPQFSSGTTTTTPPAINTTSGTQLQSMLLSLLNNLGGKGGQ